MSEWAARRLMDDWQSRGWVEFGANNVRRLTAGVLGRISQADQGSQPPTGVQPLQGAGTARTQAKDVGGEL
jgi:hypothetical protein